MTDVGTTRQRVQQDSVHIKTSVLDEFPYLGTIKYTCLNFLHAFLLKLLMEESKFSIFRVQCLDKVLHETKFDVEGWNQYLARFNQRVG